MPNPAFRMLAYRHQFHADNPFAVSVAGPKGEVGYVLAFQPKSFDWRERRASPHPWGGPHQKVLAAVLKKLDAFCGICEIRSTS